MISLKLPRMTVCTIISCNTSHLSYLWMPYTRTKAKSEFRSEYFPVQLVQSTFVLVLWNYFFFQCVNLPASKDTSIPLTSSSNPYSPLCDKAEGAGIITAVKDAFKSNRIRRCFFMDEPSQSNRQVILFLSVGSIQLIPYKAIGLILFFLLGPWRHSICAWAPEPSLYNCCVSAPQNRRQLKPAM